MNILAQGWDDRQGTLRLAFFFTRKVDKRLFNIFNNLSSNQIFVLYHRNTPDQL